MYLDNEKCVYGILLRRISCFRVDRHGYEYIVLLIAPSVLRRRARVPILLGCETSAFNAGMYYEKTKRHTVRMDGPYMR